MARQLGMICRTMMRAEGAPMALAATTCSILHGQHLGPHGADHGGEHPDDDGDDDLSPDGQIARTMIRPGTAIASRCAAR